MHVLASARPRGRPWSAPRAWRGDRELTLGQPRHGGQDAASPRAGPKSVRTAEAARAPKRYARGLGGHFAGASQARLGGAPDEGCNCACKLMSFAVDTTLGVSAGATSTLNTSISNGPEGGRLRALQA